MDKVQKHNSFKTQTRWLR